MANFLKLSTTARIALGVVALGMLTACADTGTKSYSAAGWNDLNEIPHTSSSF
ncbi:hypothetical protein GCM10008927_24100 [Amylibacter ulvae]|uniref:Uncharacterized protein n=1 Tax=Paramylibacter ulvae TaxID=1651968 RepID=A0ABQ3D9E4_9RHOB|nr:hypothetical protein GCM10008927_24100 [Amylibacter ulvae]